MKYKEKLNIKASKIKLVSFLSAFILWRVPPFFVFCLFSSVFCNGQDLILYSNTQIFKYVDILNGQNSILCRPYFSKQSKRLFFQTM